MRRLIAGSILACAALSAPASDDSIIGTHAVAFQPIRTEGTLQACTLVYRAVQADSAYLNGNPVVVAGSIGVWQFGANMALALKVGIRDLAGDNPIVHPNFAYLQSKTSSTAKVKQYARNGDDGYQLITYSFSDSTVQKLVAEMFDARQVTVAFNRREGGMDVLVPIEFDVVDASPTGGDTVLRKRSDETLANFKDCNIQLIGQAQSSREKK